MAYFPFFVELSDKNALIVGGGTVALRKAEKLLPYGVRLTVAAPAFLPEFEAMREQVTLLHRPYGPDLLRGMLFVIAATDDMSLNRRISAQCRQRDIPVNVVDDRKACTFLCPALVQDGPLSVGISTGGASPLAAIDVKERIRGILPEDYGAILSWLSAVREPVLQSIAEEKQRTDFFKWLYRRCLAQGQPPADRTFQDLMNEYEKEVL